jgi:hypothetical protein
LVPFYVIPSHYCATPVAWLERMALIVALTLVFHLRLLVALGYLDCVSAAI